MNTNELICRFCSEPIKENKTGGWGSPPYIHNTGERGKNHNAVPIRNVKKGRPVTPPRKR